MTATGGIHNPVLVKEANERLEDAAKAARSKMTDRDRLDALERTCDANRAEIRRLHERCDELQRQPVTRKKVGDV